MAMINNKHKTKVGNNSKKNSARFKSELTFETPNIMSGFTLFLPGPQKCMNIFKFCRPNTINR